jgi:hypothetical protein
VTGPTGAEVAPALALPALTATAVAAIIVPRSSLISVYPSETGRARKAAGDRPSERLACPLASMLRDCHTHSIAHFGRLTAITL